MKNYFCFDFDESGEVVQDQRAMMNMSNIVPSFIS